MKLTFPDAINSLPRRGVAGHAVRVSILLHHVRRIATFSIEHLIGNLILKTVSSVLV